MQKLSKGVFFQIDWKTYPVLRGQVKTIYSLQGTCRVKGDFLAGTNQDSCQKLQDFVLTIVEKKMNILTSFFIITHQKGKSRHRRGLLWIKKELYRKSKKSRKKAALQKKTVIDIVWFELNLKQNFTSNIATQLVRSQKPTIYLFLNLFLTVSYSFLTVFSSNFYSLQKLPLIPYNVR